MVVGAPELQEAGQELRPKAGGTRQILGIDLIRIAAAVLVMFYHLGFWIWRAEPPFHPPPELAKLTPLCSAGWVGVEIFFVLSGFVIVYSVQNATPRRFLRHRFKRLVPTALLCASLTAAVLLTAYPLRVVAGWWARSVVFFPRGPWVDGSYWTLPVEVTFYGLVFCTLLLRKKAVLEGALAFLGIASSVFCILLMVLPAGHAAWLTRFAAAAAFPPLACLLPLYGCFFALGAFLFLFLLRGRNAIRLALVLLCGTGCLAESTYHGLSFEHAFGGNLVAGIATAIWLTSVVLLIASVPANDRLQQMLGPKRTRWVRQLGIATYPLYLLHDKLGQVGIGGLHRRVGYPAALGLSMVVMLALAWAVAEAAEPWLRRTAQQAWFAGQRAVVARRG